MPTFQEVLTEPTAPAASTGKQTQFNPQRQGSVAGDIIGGLASVAGDALAAFKAVETDDEQNLFVGQIQDAHKRIDREAEQGIITPSVAAVRRDQAEADLASGIKDASTLTNFRVAQDLVRGTQTNTEKQEEAIKNSQLIAGTALLPPTASKDERIEAGARSIKRKAELEINTALLQQQTARTKVEVQKEEDDGTNYTNLLMEDVAPWVTLASNLSITALRSGDKGAILQAQTAVANASRQLELTTLAGDSFVSNMGHSAAQKTTRENLKGRIDSFRTTLTNASKFPEVANSIEYITKNAELDAHKTLNFFTKLQLYSKAGRGFEGLVNGVLSDPEVKKAFVHGMRPIDPKADDPTDAVIGTLKDPNVGKSVDPAHASAVFKTSRVALDYMNKAGIEEFSPDLSKDWANRIVPLLDLGMTHSKNADELLLLQEKYLGPKADQFLADLKPDLQKAISTKGLGLVSQSLTTALLDNEVGTAIGEKSLPTVGISPAQPVLIESGREKVPVIYSYSPDQGRFIPTTESGTPVDSFLENDETALRATQLNGALDLAVRLAKYHPQTKNLTETQVRNMYTQEAFAKANGGPLVAGQSFPKGVKDGEARGFVNATMDTKRVIATHVPFDTSKAFNQLLTGAQRRTTAAIKAVSPKEVKIRRLRMSDDGVITEE